MQEGDDMTRLQSAERGICMNTTATRTHWSERGE
jgi:hypothetical protein